MNKAATQEIIIGSNRLLSLLFSVGLICMWLIGYRTPSQSGLFLGDAIGLVLLPIAAILIWYTQGFDSLLPKKIPKTVLITLFALIAYWSTLPHFNARAFLKDSMQFSFYIYFCWLAVRFTDERTVLRNALLLVSALITIELLVQFMFHLNIYTDIAKHTKWLWLSGGNVVSINKSLTVATALFQNRNQLAMFGAAIFAYFIFDKKWLLATLAVGTVVLSGSRTGMGMSALIMVAFLIYGSIYNRKLLLPFIAVLITACIALFTFGDFIVEKFIRLLDWRQDNSTNQRILIYKQAFAAWKEFRLTGSGLGQLKPSSGLDNLENSWARYFYEFGLIGLLFLYKVIASIRRRAPQAPQTAALIALVLMALTQPFLWQSQIAILFSYLVMKTYISKKK
ncbi:MAG: O-antigen ligase family protein [Reinekea sp.]